MSYAPYSYSKIATHKKCGAKFKYAYVDQVKVERIPSPQMDRGTAVHKSVENFFIGGNDMLHPDIHEVYGQFFYGLRESYQCFTEQPFAIKNDWSPCEFDSPEAWVRGFLDLKILPRGDDPGELIIYEFKTGNIYEEEHAAQRLLYGTIGLVQHSEFPHAKVITVYFDKKDMREVIYPRIMLPECKALAKHTIEMIEKDQLFIAKPSYGCRWCQFSKYNNGPCAF